MASNYDDVLSQLRAAGLIVPELRCGKMQRCRVEGDREFRGWYALHEIRLDSGDEVYVGSYGVWHGNDNGAQKITLHVTPMSKEQRDVIRARQRADMQQANREQQQRAARAAEKAQTAWGKMSGNGSSEHLIRKGVAGHGVRYSPSGALVIPMTDIGGYIHGLQVIRDKTHLKPEMREKEYWPAGLAKQGHFHLIGGVPTWILLIAEGYSTAASLHEATGYPVAVAFDAGNLTPVAEALHRKYGYAKILICADDDQFQKCRRCKGRLDLLESPTQCPACGEEHKATNAGLAAASSAALIAHGQWVRPYFSDQDKRRSEFFNRGRKRSDYNDLHAHDGLQAVRAQIEARLTELGWVYQVPESGANTTTTGSGDRPLQPINSVTEMLERYALVYGQGSVAFDAFERRLVKLADIRDACVNKQTYTWWLERPDRRIVRVENVGFDPTESDPLITCNLWSGWPTKPELGKCDHLLTLLEYLCSADSNQDELREWLTKWIAYPIQNPGAKMKTAVVMHGPQGTGKNLFWETVQSIYGHYGHVINQDALEDKFNDWASKKLFLIADEVVSRHDLYQLKNKLKSFITGDWIRINPKGTTAYHERNHVNLVFLSNETMPVVLEEDDRRHAVFWNPPKLEPEFYQKVLNEIANGGGAALHDYLLEVDLSGFGPGTLPPISDAKSELINQSMDSTSRFAHAWIDKEIDRVIVRPARSQHVYKLYLWYCNQQGLKAATQPRLINVLTRKHGFTAPRKRFRSKDYETSNPVAILIRDDECPAGKDEKEWLGHHIEAFKTSLADLWGTAND